jgi:hypothetical protein
MVERLCTDNCSAIDHRHEEKFLRRAPASYKSEEILVDTLAPCIQYVWEKLSFNGNRCRTA